MLAFHAGLISTGSITISGGHVYSTVDITATGKALTIGTISASGTITGTKVTISGLATSAGKGRMYVLCRAVDD